MKLFTRFKTIRKATGMTQQAIADILGITRPQYQLYESGKREMPLHLAVIFAKHLHCSLDYLTELTDDFKSFNFMDDILYPHRRLFFHADHDAKNKYLQELPDDILYKILYNQAKIYLEEHNMLDEFEEAEKSGKVKLEINLDEFKKSIKEG